ncbi:MAG: 1-deoxy-D-xylulose-5-phosphate synthase [Proteobacteria bacterium]|nr:1-deoxy-D-xylulose-5-phosphate synthase [Pseudomonadota bacterium]
MTIDNGSQGILQGLKRPGDVQDLDSRQLVTLADEMRRVIIDTVAANGGHLAPSLGVVELTLALLKVFDPDQDKIVWDVGHQAYGYKLLTGRAANFGTLRTMGGVSGFPKMSESRYDHFGVGHSSTSISAAVGMAKARDLAGKNHKVVAVIGDGSMTAGQAYEGLNQGGDQGSDLVVVLNDNEMSISRNVGALSQFFSRNLTKSWVVRFKKDVEALLKHVPKIGADLADYARKSEEAFKHFFTPGMLFEAFRFNYLGPFDGHNIDGLAGVFQQVRELKGPILVHVLTQKGKGYEPAESNPTYFHGVGCFEPETGEAKKFGACAMASYTDVFGETLTRLAEEDERIVAITAAMPEGTGLIKFAERFPDRFVDVGICEQHAVTYAAGMATQGFKPVVAIYSTFMQRSYDQIVHDVCLQNLPVTLCLDRGGLVGEDGPTHHGAFDLSFLRHIPNLVCMAPKDEAELAAMLATAMAHDGPVALRYPRGVGVGAIPAERLEPLPLGQGELLRDGQDAVIIALGSRVHPSLVAAQEIEAETGKKVAVFNARFVRPLPAEQIAQLVARFKVVITVEENALAGGFGSAVLEMLADRGICGVAVRRLGLPDAFVEHGKQKELRASLGLDKNGIKASVLGALE